MTTYYVRKTGSDGAAGTSAGAAWLTIDKAANTVAAGDTVYIGAGVYRELVTMDTSGSSGSQISYIADVTGAFTGDAGLVFISAYADEVTVSARAMCVDMNGKSFITWKYVNFLGGTAQSVGNTANASHIAYEGCTFEYCTFEHGTSGHAFKVEINNGATPTANGLYLLNCTFYGVCTIHWDSNGSAMVNLKWTVENCTFIGSQGAASAHGFDMRRQANGGANCVGGVTILGCLFISCNEGVYLNNFVNTTHITYVRNSRFIGCTIAIDNQSGSAAATVVENTLASATPTLVAGTAVWPSTMATDSPFILAGIHDMQYRALFGHSPYGHAFTPLRSSTMTDPAVDSGEPFGATTVDAYGNPRKMGRASSGVIYYFDASDDAVSDPNTVWSNDANLADNSLSTLAFANTAGSTSSNYLFAGGTNAPGSGDTISSVEVRMRGYNDAGSMTCTATVFTDSLGENLGSVSFTNTTPAAWTSWVALSTPTGGWTWAKVQALEVKVFKASGSSFVNVAQVQVRVITAAAGIDIGPVESRIRAAQETGTVHAGTYSGVFSGAGYQDRFYPVNAASTTVTAYCRKDGNYSGTNPKMEVVNIPGVADQSDSLSVASGNWEQLSVNFTPTSAGIVRVRLWSYDTSATGKCFFDDLVVS